MNSAKSQIQTSSFYVGLNGTITMSATHAATQIPSNDNVALNGSVISGNVFAFNVGYENLVSMTGSTASAFFGFNISAKSVPRYGCDRLTPELELFRSGRQFAAWIGLARNDHSMAGKLYDPAFYPTQMEV